MIDRAAGVHWGTGEDADSEIWGYLADGAPTILNEPEARHHWFTVKSRRSGLTIFRSSPYFTPGEMGWNAEAYSHEIFKGLDFHNSTHGVYPTDVQQGNERNLDYERDRPLGDNGAYDLNPANWPTIYGQNARFDIDLLGHLRERERERGISIRWWYQPWAPGHGEFNPEIAAIWVPAAKLYDGVVMHAYTTTDDITQAVLWYLQWFTQPLVLGEWNTINFAGNYREATKESRRTIMALRIEEEKRIRARLSTIAALVPRFQAVYFIDRWAEDDSHEHDIQGNNARRWLWTGETAEIADHWPDMPQWLAQSATEPSEPTPEEPSVPESPFVLPVWSPAPIDIIEGNKIVAAELGIPVRMKMALSLAECRESLDQFERWGSTAWTEEAKGYIATGNREGLQSILNRIKSKNSNDISFGPDHQTWFWSPEYPGNRADPNDPARYNLDLIMAFRAKYIQDHGYALRISGRALRDLWRTYQPNELETLCRYNKPDGTASASVRKRYSDMLALAPAYLGPVEEPRPAEPKPNTGNVDGVIVDQYTDPMPAGWYATQPLGVILHGSRSGKAGNPKSAEYAGTAGYEVNNPDGLGWTATIGEDRYAVHMSAKRWGWNARGKSDEYLAVEFAQATVDEPITDAQVRAFVAFMRSEVLPVWPGMPLNFPTHSELDGTPGYGQFDGKSDVFPKNDPRAEELRGRIMAALEATFPEPAPPPEPTPQPEPEYDPNPDGHNVGTGILGSMVYHLDHAATDEVFTKDESGNDRWSEAYGRSGTRYVWVPALGRVVRHVDG